MVTLTNTALGGTGLQHREGARGWFRLPKSVGYGKNSIAWRRVSWRRHNLLSGLANKRYRFHGCASCGVGLQMAKRVRSGPKLNVNSSLPWGSSRCHGNRIAHCNATGIFGCRLTTGASFLDLRTSSHKEVKILLARE